MIEADENPTIGYNSIAFTIVALYLGASDTLSKGSKFCGRLRALIIHFSISNLSNTMRWLMMVLTEHPEIQEICHKEIQTSIKKDGEILKANCPYLRKHFRIIKNYSISEQEAFFKWLIY